MMFFCSYIYSSQETMLAIRVQIPYNKHFSCIKLIFYFLYPLSGIRISVSMWHSTLRICLFNDQHRHNCSPECPHSDDLCSQIYLTFSYLNLSHINPCCKQTGLWDHKTLQLVLPLRKICSLHYKTFSPVQQKWVKG